MIVKEMLTDTHTQNENELRRLQNAYVSQRQRDSARNGRQTVVQRDCHLRLATVTFQLARRRHMTSQSINSFMANLRESLELINPSIIRGHSQRRRRQPTEHLSRLSTAV